AGSAPHFGIVRQLAQAGIPRDSVVYLDMPPPEAKAAFESGQVEAWAIWPPFVEQEVIAGNAKILQGVTTAVQVPMTVRGKFAQEHPEAVKGLIAALDRAREWIVKNP